MDRVATYTEAFREYAYNAGFECPDREWISTPWDTWERNPHYTGPKGLHPEADPEDGDVPAWEPTAQVPLAPLEADEIPF